MYWGNRLSWPAEECEDHGPWIQLIIDPEKYNLCRSSIFPAPRMRMPWCVYAGVDIYSFDPFQCTFAMEVSKWIPVVGSVQCGGMVPIQIDQ